MRETPCCYQDCNQGRDCIQRAESRLQTRVVAVALVLVIGLVVASVLI